MRILNFLKNLFGKKSLKKEKNPFRGECDFCFKKIDDVGKAYLCKYCGEWHCLEHRLPEDHACLGNPQNPHIN